MTTNPTPALPPAVEEALGGLGDYMQHAPLCSWRYAPEERDCDCGRDRAAQNLRAKLAAWQAEHAAELARVEAQRDKAQQESMGVFLALPGYAKGDTLAQRVLALKDCHQKALDRAEAAEAERDRYKAALERREGGA